MKKVSRVWILFLLATQSAAQAQDPPKEPYCAQEERYYPDGLIGQIGEHFFRICTGGFAYPPLVNQPYLKLGSEQRLDAYAEENFPDIREYFGRIRNHYGSLKDLPHLGRNKSEEVGQIELGGLVYSVFVSKIGLSHVTLPVRKANMPKRFRLVFPGSKTPDIPEHSLSCGKGDPLRVPEKGYQCYLHVRYTSFEDVYVRRGVIHIVTVKPSSFINTRPFDFDRLALFAQQLRDAYRYIEVTDQLGELKDVPIVQISE